MVYDQGNRAVDAMVSWKSALLPSPTLCKEISVRCHSFLLLIIGAWAAGAVSAPADDKPVRLIAEAEDFSVERGWNVVPYGEDYFASTLAITFLSRQACLGAPEHTEAGAEAVVSQDFGRNRPSRQ